MRAPGFGAHVLAHPNAKRHAANVASVTLAVFDVDMGSAAQVAACRDLISSKGYAAHFYSSYSHRPDKPAYRLILPLSRPLTPGEWPGLRLGLITALRIPCNPGQSGDVSRFWFLPSHPPGATPAVFTHVGAPVDVEAVLSFEEALAAATPAIATATPASVDFVPPPEPEGPVDMGPLRIRLRSRAQSFERSKDQKKSHRGVLLRSALAGEPLAEHGERNTAMLSATALIAYGLPSDTPLSVLMNLIRPSLNAMVAAGSKLTESVVEGMFLRAMKKRRVDDLNIETLRETLLKQRAEALAELTSPKGTP